MGIVSSRRMDPAFWGDPADPAKQLASTKQMLTKYIALMYLHVPASYDPSSRHVSAAERPDGGPDDLYESDIHPRNRQTASADRDGPAFRLPTPCDWQIEAAFSFGSGLQTWSRKCAQPAKQFFRPNSVLGQLSRATWISSLTRFLPSNFAARTCPDMFVPWSGIWKPTIVTTARCTLTARESTFMDIIREDGDRNHLDRISPGRGFSEQVVFESHEDAEEIYGSRMIWTANHFKLQFRDGSWSTFLPCNDGRCYWVGYSGCTRQ